MAVIISNNAAGPLTNVTITNEGPVPVGGVSQQDGTTLASKAGLTTTVLMISEPTTITLRNVIAQTRTGRADNVVMLGAHLDSVAAGPGINDNGSGVAALLEIANKLGSSPKVNNAVRFGFWGAEERGLLGSEYYVKNLDFRAAVRHLDVPELRHDRITERRLLRL